MLFSKSCEYALQAMVFLAAQPPNVPVLQRDISDNLDIPPHFLGKILQTLVKHDLMLSQKGKTGGFLLNGRPEDFALLDVVRIIDGPTYLDDCVMGFPGCKDDNPCPVHNEWSAVKTEIMKMLQNRHIGDLSKDINQKLNFIELMKTKS